MQKETVDNYAHGRSYVKRSEISKKDSTGIQEEFDRQRESVDMLPSQGTGGGWTRIRKQRQIKWPRNKFKKTDEQRGCVRLSKCKSFPQTGVLTNTAPTTPISRHLLPLNRVYPT